MSVLVYRASKFPLPSIHLRISTNRSVAGVLGAMDAAFAELNYSAVIPSHPFDDFGKLVGKVEGSSFSFFKFKFLQIEITPHCFGTVATVKGTTVINARIRHYGFLIQLGISCVFAFFFLYRGKENSLIFAILMLSATLSLQILFWQGARRLHVILLGFANED